MEQAKNASDTFFLDITCEIVSAYVSNNPISQLDLAFDDLGTQTPPVRIGEITEDFAIKEAARNILKKRDR